MRFLRRAAFAVLLMPLTVQAQVIDQNAPNNSVYMAAFAQCCLAQSFQQSASNIDGAGIFMQAGVGSSAQLTIGLWNLLPNQVGAAEITNGTVLATQGTWADVFWSAVSVVPNTTYYLVFTTNDNSMGIAGDVGNGYANGNVYATPGYQSFSSFDYAFRTYQDPNGVVATPEPASLVLLGTGLLTLGGIARRRNRAS